MKAILFSVALTMLFAPAARTQNRFAFYKNGHELFTGLPAGETTRLGEDIKIKGAQLYHPSTHFTYSPMPKEILRSMSITDGMGFHSALHFPDEKTWLFLERSMETGSYNVYFFNEESLARTKIISEANAPDPDYAFRPIAWLKEKNTIYFEAMIFGSANENEGIWSYDLGTKDFSKLGLTSSYLTTPDISPDGNFFIYGATTGLKGPESEVNSVYFYDLQKNEEILVTQDEQSFFSIIGWSQGEIKATNILKTDEEDTSFFNEYYPTSVVPQIPFKLPWPSATVECVNRTGSNPPNINFPAVCGTSGCSNHTGAHDYLAIDFGLFYGDKVLAVAAGTVVYAWFNANGTTTLTGGYGNLVKIRHSDNTYTYYAHLREIAVKVGDVVSQGCILGTAGNTGHSSGPHLHFEWRDVNDAKYTSSLYWPVFSEYGCTPNQNKLYTSQNTQIACVSHTFPHCTGAVTLTCGQPYAGKTEGKVSSLNNVTTGDFSNHVSNPYNSWKDPGPEDFYKVVTTSTGTITATLSNMVSGLDLDVFILTGCSFYNSGANNVTIGSTSCTMTNAPAGTYYIMVSGAETKYPSTQTGSTTYNGHYGNYTLSVSCGSAATCQTPTNLTTTNITANAATFNWSAVSGASNYSVQWRYPNQIWQDLTGGPWSSTSLNVNGFASNTTYEWRVRANCNAGQTSAWSAAASFTTLGENMLPNNNCSNAIALTVGTNCINTSATNVGATASTPAPSGGCPSLNYKDVWFKFNMPNVPTPQVTIRTTAGTLSDAVMEVYYGSTCSTMTYIVCEDDNLNGNGSAMPVINLQGGPNNTIWVRVWGYSGTSGTFSICVLNYNSPNFNADGNEDIYTVPEASFDAQVVEETVPPGIPSLTVRENLTSRLQITPNPATDALTVAFTQTENFRVLSVVLRDVSSKVVFTRQSESPEAGTVVESFDVAHLRPGLYVLEVVTTKGIVAEKIIVH